MTTPVLSVCVSLKNRSRLVTECGTLSLFPNCVRSLASAAEEFAQQIELVVADFHSDDWPLAEWIGQAAESLALQVVPVDGSFSRGRGLNAAVRQASCKKLLLLDADMVVRSAALCRGLECNAERRVWFPVCQCLDQQGKVAGWQDWGYGNVGLTMQDLEQAGGVPEYDSWGGEDYVLRDALSERFQTIRERTPGLFHQWHPEAARHAFYGKPEYADYRAHQACVEADRHGGIRYRFDCIHPHWQGVLDCYVDGTMARPGIDQGRYELEERHQIVLRWDRWPAEILTWDNAGGRYRHLTKDFSLTPQRTPTNQYGDSGV